MPVTACADDPALFDSTDIIDHRDAARHCLVCPVLDWCSGELAAASSAGSYSYGPGGTWAGRLFLPTKGEVAHAAHSRTV